MAEAWSVPPWQIESEISLLWWERWQIWSAERAALNKRKSKSNTDKPDYKLRIIVEGEDCASGPLGNVAGSLGRIGEFAAGSLQQTVSKKHLTGR
ncbi:hypothetical protein [Promineifilum sp.]|uniref:hypothetical protein n=1 Tax=Promineifilum sp. TaxID=2664178 RepID=UPI0031CCA695